MRKILFAIILISLITLPIALFLKRPVESDMKIDKTVLSVGGKHITVEVADSPEEMERGLSGREVLGENEGMYFILGHERNMNFWMKEMKFPLDLIWVKNEMVVGIEKNASIPSGNYIPSFASPGAVTNVLEVNAGWSDRNGLKVGDEVNLENSN